MRRVCPVRVYRLTMPFLFPDGNHAIFSVPRNTPATLSNAALVELDEQNASGWRMLFVSLAFTEHHRFHVGADMLGYAKGVRVHADARGIGEVGPMLYAAWTAWTRRAALLARYITKNVLYYDRDI